MATYSSLQKSKALYCSSSISNFQDKLQRRFNLPKWHVLRSMGKHAIFFGMYNPVDYFIFLWHYGKKTIFWCGSDIKNLQKRKYWQFVLNKIPAKHICENVVEQRALSKMGIKSVIQPCLIDRAKGLKVSFQPNKNPNVYLCVQPGREKEYGLELIKKYAYLVPEVTFHVYGGEEYIFNTKNIRYYGKVSNEQFNKDIKNYQAALRLNTFDGFSEVLAKSVMMGQYPISVISYPHITHVKTVKDLIKSLKGLSKKKKPNMEARAYWEKQLNRSLYEILSAK